jgi:hypothetical protein
MTASEKRMLKVLAVILVLMAIVWGRRYMSKKSSSSSVRGQQRGVATASRRTTTKSPGVSSSSSGNDKKQVLTPRDIPRLNDNLQLKLKQMKNPDVKAVNDEDILYDTTNIWLPINTSDREVEKIRRAEKSASVGAEMQADTMFFRGVAHVNGERLAILERADRTIPWYVKQGDALEDTSFVITNISDDDRQCTLLDQKAKRERDKYRTIPWSGIEELPEDVGSVKPPGTKPPVANVEAPDSFQPGVNDLEIIE